MSEESACLFCSISSGASDFGNFGGGRRFFRDHGPLLHESSELQSILSDASFKDPRMAMTLLGCYVLVGGESMYCNAFYQMCTGLSQPKAIIQVVTPRG